MTNTARVLAALDLLELEAQKRAAESSATIDIESRMYLGGQSVGMREVMAKVRAALAEGAVEPPSGHPFRSVGTEEASAAVNALAADAIALDEEIGSDNALKAAIEVRAGTLLDVIADRDHHRKQVTELQADNTRFMERARAAEWKVIGMLARVGGSPVESFADAGDLDPKGEAVRGWRTIDSAIAEMMREPNAITVVRDDHGWRAQLDADR